ncbi:MAG TPA: glycoside hydrolase family 28 protein [Streptosporangiales bacterium]
MARRHSRRDLLKAAGLVLGGAAAVDAGVLGAPGLATAATGPDASAWRRAGRILARVRPPRFPNRSFPITDFGAVADGTTDCTGALRDAIERCHDSGGGHVVVPAGTFLTGAIHLLSNVDLHLSRGATLKFSKDPAAYLPVVYTRWQGIELMNYSAFIYAFEQENIGITGEGTLDGQAGDDAWWPWSGSTRYGWSQGQPNQDADWTLLQQLADDGVPVEQRVFGPGHYLRPNFIQPYRCRNVVVDGVTVTNSPMWEVNPVLCTNVTVQNYKVDSHGPNNDGCDPESCRDVVIQRCTFDTGDDCIAIKAGRNADGRRVNVPSEDIVIRDCDFADGHGGVTMGSEMTGGIRNVFAEDLRMNSPNLNNCLRLKTNSARGGFIEEVYLRNTSVGQVAQVAFLVDFFYDEGPGHGFNPTVADIHVSDLTVDTAQQPWYLVGYPDDHIRDVSLTDCTFTTVAKDPVTQYVDDLVLRNVTVNGQPVG